MKEGNSGERGIPERGVFMTRSYGPCRTRRILEGSFEKDTYSYCIVSVSHCSRYTLAAFKGGMHEGLDWRWPGCHHAAGLMQEHPFLRAVISDTSCPCSTLRQPSLSGNQSYQACGDQLTSCVPKLIQILGGCKGGGQRSFMFLG